MLGKKNLDVWVLGVLKDYRKQGIGSRLLQVNEELAHQAGLETVTLSVLNASSDMQILLLKRGYLIERVSPHRTNLKYNAVYFKFSLKNYLTTQP